jgi:hypothetical protein
MDQLDSNLTAGIVDNTGHFFHGIAKIIRMDSHLPGQLLPVRPNKRIASNNQAYAALC